MERLFFVVPLIGLVSWIAHAAATLLDRGSRAVRLGLRTAALGFEPLAVLVLCVVLVRRPQASGGLEDDPSNSIVLILAGMAGLTVWSVALLTEPLIQWLARRVHRSRDAKAAVVGG